MYTPLYTNNYQSSREQDEWTPTTGDPENQVEPSFGTYTPLAFQGFCVNHGLEAQGDYPPQDGRSNPVPWNMTQGILPEMSTPWDPPWVPLHMQQAAPDVSAQENFALGSPTGEYSATGLDQTFVTSSTLEPSQPRFIPSGHRSSTSNPSQHDLSHAPSFTRQGMPPTSSSPNWCIHPPAGSFFTTLDRGFTNESFGSQMVQQAPNQTRTTLTQTPDTMQSLVGAVNSIASFGSSTSPNGSQITADFSFAPQIHLQDAPKQGQETVFHLTSGQNLRPLTGRRKSTKEEKNHSRNIRNSGGACDRCRISKKKCDPSHPRPAHRRASSARSLGGGPRSDDESNVVMNSDLESHVPSTTVTELFSAVPSFTVSPSLSGGRLRNISPPGQEAMTTIRRSPHSFGKYDPGMGGQFLS